MSSVSTIMIIDDEPSLCRTLALILQQAGYSVTAAGNAQEAYRCLKAGAYDLVFLDLQMPDVNGLDLLPDIHRLYPETPVLILTANATLESAIEAVRQGARDYLLKPIDPKHILSRVQQVLAEQQQPKRQREIVSQVQDLLTELHRINSLDVPPHNPPAAMLPPDPARILQRGPFTLDLHTRYVSLENQSITLSPTAFDYLVTLVRHSPDPVPYKTLVMEAQGYKTTPIEAREIVRWRIHELRKAIEPNSRRPRYIITVRNVGYRLVT